MENYKKKYIGAKKISDLELSVEKTLLGKEMYLVKYYDNFPEELLPGEVIKIIVTKQPTDATTLRDLKVKPVVEKILAILAESDLRLEESQYALDLTAKSVVENIQRVFTKLWGKEYPERTMMDMERILTKK